MKRKLRTIFLLLSLILVSLPSVFVLGLNTSANNTVVWTEGKEYEYEIVEGSAYVEHLGTLDEDSSFKMILGSSEDIFVQPQWDELKVKFQKLSPEPGEETQLVRPYLTNVSNPSQSTSDMAPPFFVWLLNESARTEDGEVHRYFNDFYFNGAEYDGEEGILTFFNGSRNPDLGYGKLVIELKNDGNGNGGPIVFPWWAQAFIAGILSAIGGIIIRYIYENWKKKKEKDNL